jgi:hypothetical protein
MLFRAAEEGDNQTSMWNLKQYNENTEHCVLGNCHG